MDKTIREGLGLLPRTEGALAAAALQKTNEELGDVAGALATELVEVQDLGTATQIADTAYSVISTSSSEPCTFPQLLQAHRAG